MRSHACVRPPRRSREREPGWGRVARMGRIPSGIGSARSSSRCTRAPLPKGACRGRQEPRAWRQPCAR
eukprot:6684052-Prymnesium_polylepis.1